MPSNEKTGERAGAVRVDAGLSSQPHQPRYNFDGSGGPGPKYLRTEDLLGRHGEGLYDRLIVRAAERLLGLDTVNALCLKAGTPWPSSREMIRHLFRELDIEWSVTNPEVFEALGDRPTVFVFNHPYGMADAFAVNNMLEAYRPNFRLFANSFLTIADSITHRLLFVDPFLSEKNRAMNRRSMLGALKHLKEGGDLALFPGRLCSHLTWGNTRVQDGEWTDQVKVFVDAGNAQLVPLHVPGRNSWRFQAAGMLHPKLRTLLILREFLRGGHRIDFNLGEPIQPAQLAKAARAVSPGRLARAITYSANPTYAEKRRKPLALPLRHGAARKSAKRAETDIETFLKDCPVLVAHGALKVLSIDRGLPDALTGPVGQVRFDAYAGEAAVASPDALIDPFDDIYSHLVLWDADASRIAGSYRYLIPSRIEKFKRTDLVTASIFDMRKPFRRLLPHALELGRAAIGSDYQRSYAPLMMMWRGVMDILRRDKSIKYLIGPVTISQAFSPLSRHLLKRFIEKKYANPRLAGSAVPKKAFTVPLAPEVDIDRLAGEAETISEIAGVIEAIERGKRTLPVLYRQYSNLGLRYVATGEWPELDHAMASLAVLDLVEAKRDFIARYLGKDNVPEFFEGR